MGSERATGAIQANLVNSAPSIPLPQIAPPTPNVLAYGSAEPAPAPPSKADDTDYAAGCDPAGLAQAEAEAVESHSRLRRSMRSR